MRGCANQVRIGISHDASHFDVCQGTLDSFRNFPREHWTGRRRRSRTFHNIKTCLRLSNLKRKRHHVGNYQAFLAQSLESGLQSGWKSAEHPIVHFYSSCGTCFENLSLKIFLCASLTRFRLHYLFYEYLWQLNKRVERRFPQEQYKVFKSTLAADTPRGSGESRDTYNVAQNIEGTDACAKVGLDALGITGPTTIHRNLTFQELFEHEQANNEGKVAATENGDTFTVYTGKYTGRSPKDKWVVYNEGSQSAENIDWNDINRATTPEVFDELYDKAVAYFNTVDKAYVFDCYCGASPKSRKKIRFVHEMAWQQHFVSNMFIRPQTKEELDNFEPDLTIINCCSQVDEDWKRHNLNSETAVVFDIEKGKAVIFGTWYGGENKKGVFSLMNYWLPLADPPQLPMHCSANVGRDGDVALFFGLSGTGKTTLSADPHRALIGDDEHGWDEDGIYNFEGGCYAKTINLSEATEPDIYHAIRTDALLENVVLEGENNVPDYFDTSITENGRVSYPIFHIPGYVS